MLKEMVCMDCGCSVEDTKEGFMDVILDERRFTRPICIPCKQKRLKKAKEG